MARSAPALARKRVAAVLTGQKFGILATLGRKYPYQNIVAFAATRDKKNILFATKRATSKYENLKRNKRVAMFVDDRSNRETDLRDATGVAALGEAREMRGADRKKFAAFFLRQHPLLRDFLSDPDCALFAIRVRVYYLVRRFEEVSEIRM